MDLGFYLCSVLSKSVGVLLPVAFLLLDALVAMKLCQVSTSHPSLFRVFTQCGKQKAPVLLVLLVFAGITLWSNEKGAKVDTDVLSLTLSARVLKALAVPAWTASQLLWPVRLRVHFQLREDDFDRFLTSPECLLPVVGLLLSGAVCGWHTKQHQSPQLLLGGLYFCIMLLPTSGLIQHGIVTLGCARYAYFPSMVLVPFGGYALGHILFGVNEPEQPVCVKQHSPKKLTSHRTRDPSVKSEVRRTSSESPPTFSRAKCVKSRAWLALLGTLCAFVVMSTLQMENWRNEVALYRHSLR